MCMTKIKAFTTRQDVGNCARACGGHTLMWQQVSDAARGLCECERWRGRFTPQSKRQYRGGQ